MPIRIRHGGSLERTRRFAKRMEQDHIFGVLDAAGRAGVDALSVATPSSSGTTASAWSYMTEVSSDAYTVHWINDSQNKGFYIVIGLQYGHGTGTGGYVVGRDFINPALRPIFDAIADRVWKEVVNA